MYRAGINEAYKPAIQVSIGRNFLSNKKVKIGKLVNSGFGYFNSFYSLEFQKKGFIVLPVKPFYKGVEWLIMALVSVALVTSSEIALLVDFSVDN